MHLPINVKSPNNISKWQMEFNSAFKGLNKEDFGTAIVIMYLRVGTDQQGSNGEMSDPCKGVAISNLVQYLTPTNVSDCPQHF
jgi:hypothetical protein